MNRTPHVETEPPISLKLSPVPLKLSHESARERNTFQAVPCAFHAGNLGDSAAARVLNMLENSKATLELK